jgi:hypothetical protein
MLAYGAFGALLVLIVAFFGWQRSRPADPLAKVDMRSGVAQGTTTRLVDLVDAAERNKDLTDEEWQMYLDHQKYLMKPEIGATLTVVGIMVKEDFRHKDILIADAKKYLDGQFTEGGDLAACMTLRRFGDPQWRSYAERSLKRQTGEDAMLFRKTLKFDEK